MRSYRAVAVAVLVLAACAPAPSDAPVDRPLPDASLTNPPAPPVPVEVSQAALATRADLLRHAERGSLRGLAEMAVRNSLFVSNTGDQEHLQFWDLLRRTGVDPNRRLQDLFDLPPGERTVDGIVWYVWPDLAARDAADLVPERLTFEERRRLEDLIGEGGVAKIRDGQGYPGMRTAIAEDGTWIYFVLGQDGED